MAATRGINMLCKNIYKTFQLFSRTKLTPWQRFYSNSKSASLWDSYNHAKQKCQDEVLPPDVPLDQVFVNNELDMDNITAYGFDYDFTLACYRESLLYLLYNLAKEVLVNKHRYPSEVAKIDYQPNFAIRGLHYDIHKGLLMKIDAFHQIQLGSVYRGLTQLSTDEVLSVYGQITLPKAYVEGPLFTGQNAPMQHLTDLFSIPEIMLLLNVQDYLEKNNIIFSPDILFWDVKSSIQSVHPIMHKIVEEHVEDYIVDNPKLRVFLERLLNAQKKLFIVTNSPFTFVDQGMKFLIGSDWREMFDLTIVRARKPNFFSEAARPFRLYDTLLKSRTWEKVGQLEKGKVYMEGTLKEMKSKTGWLNPQEILYFGDHLYSDLADLTLQYGWRTGAIIKEVSDEIEIQNAEEYKRSVHWLDYLQNLISEMQTYDDPESQAIITEWEKERDHLRLRTKAMFNPQFGSLFRTYHNPTYFSRRLFRFADIYMSSVTNLLKYSLQHTFYPRRGVLPHEFRSPFM
uniref:5'-nucleotidase domain-containing protein 3 n=1 Tax=Strigamia maritima TaxID=126957 RepID=T1J4S0_STRMM